LFFPDTVYYLETPRLGAAGNQLVQQGCAVSEGRCQMKIHDYLAERPKSRARTAA